MSISRSLTAVSAVQIVICFAPGGERHLIVSFPWTTVTQVLTYVASLLCWP